ncbi:MAG: NADH:flavin oxidoreductase/NADH oxidase [Hyphomicrobiales bacterium]|nr:NADH:flavin oxidoreductase/NADH oxidase [Hyphomicrobiales bacterium]
MAHLFEPLTIRGVTFPNRIAVSPMCQYSCEDGLVNDWHLVHLGSRAIGGAGLVFFEATAVLPDGRISPCDAGIWSDAHIEPFARIVRFIHQQGGLAGIQLAHAGRKASVRRPWEGGDLLPEAEGGWTDVIGPSALAFSDQYPMPREMTERNIGAVDEAFGRAAQRALDAGFDVIEIHGAHGYLLHSFLSLLSNRRADVYGGSLENRMRFTGAVTDTVRGVWPDHLPLFVRISATDWLEGGWDVEQSIELVRFLSSRGVDLIDCSTGGTSPAANIPVGPGFQTTFADRIRRETGMPTGAVGMITDPAQADHIIRSGQADMILIARELLRDPYWPLRAARELGASMSWPAQYLRAAPRGTTEREQRSKLDFPRDTR